MKTAVIISFAAVFALSASCSKHTEEKKEALLFLPSDLEATLWAESPMFYNPTNIDVDSRGRIWVTEAVNYRNYNNDSTTALHHAAGDRVMILEDTDGDGKADASKVFVQDKDLVSPLGIAVIGNKVYVSCSPRLIVYTDHDGDDRPDEKEVLLSGFGGVDHDHSLHAVIGGPDGNLYFNTGNAGPHEVVDKSGWTLRSGSVYTGGSPYNTTNQGNMKSDDGKVWVGGLALRVEPSGKNLRVLAHNFRNAYELAVDSRGDMWQNDNDDQVVACRTTWVMEGGNAGYFSEDGTRSWAADQRPWQDVFTAHWHQDDPGVMPAGDNAGAGSPTGVVVYEGDALGVAYRGMLLSADAGRNVIFGYHPEKKGSGYDLGKRTNFITSLKRDNVGYVWNDSAHNAQPDKWFRPSDVTVGTDGALYVADWFDPVVGGHQMRDTTGYGRIYRIAPKEKKLVNPSINLGTIDGQMEAFRSPAINVRHTGLQQLKMAGPTIIPRLKEMLTLENPYYHARAIWLLAQLGASGIVEVEALLQHNDPDTRVVAFRALRALADADVTKYARLLVSDPSPWVRREVIVALRDHPLEQKKDLLLQLAAGYDGVDRWYCEALGSAMESHASLFYQELLRVFESENIPSDQWSDKLASLVWRLHPPEALQALKRRASAANLSDEQRADALTALAFIPTRDAVKAMIALAGNESRQVAEKATYWLTFRQGNEWFTLWDWRKSGIDLAHERAVAAMKVKRSRLLDPQMPMDEKRRSAREMTKDEVGVRMLLGIIAEGKLPAELYPFVEKLMANHDNESARIQAAAYFKSKEGMEVSSAAVIKRKGDISSGKAVFEKHCSSCHSLEPNSASIGPDLSSIGKKFDRQRLLDAIIFPDAGIVFGYEAWTINLTDGRSFFGFLIADGPETVTIKDLTGNNHVLKASLIGSRTRQEKSLMPSPASLGLSEQDLADVSAYLMRLPSD